jgi:hypothetical protein
MPLQWLGKKAEMGPRTRLPPLRGYTQERAVLAKRRSERGVRTGSLDRLELLDLAGRARRMWAPLPRAAGPRGAEEAEKRERLGLAAAVAAEASTTRVCLPAVAGVDAEAAVEPRETVEEEVEPRWGFSHWRPA